MLRTNIERRWNMEESVRRASVEYEGSVAVE